MNVLCSSVAPTPSPVRPPSSISPRPRAPQRAVAFRTFPPPYGPGAARPWLRRGRRKRRAGIPVMAHYPNPRPCAPLPASGLRLYISGAYVKPGAGTYPGLPPGRIPKRIEHATRPGPAQKKKPAHPKTPQIGSADSSAELLPPPKKEPAHPPLHRPPADPHPPHGTASCRAAREPPSASRARPRQPRRLPPARPRSKPLPVVAFSRGFRPGNGPRSTSSKRKPGRLLLASKNGTGFVFPTYAAGEGETATEERS